MEVNILDIRKSLNKAYLKVKPNRTQIETFKKNIAIMFDRINESESEEFHKNIISEFLKNMKKINPVVHFELPAENRNRMADFYTKAFGWQAGSNSVYQ